MEKKIHYKMHKVKKNWVAIGVTALSLLVAPKVLGLEAGIVCGPSNLQSYRSKSSKH